MHFNDRKPGIALFMDKSKLNIEKNCLYNRLKGVKIITVQWTNGIDPGELRVELKKTFID